MYLFSASVIIIHVHVYAFISPPVVEMLHQTMETAPCERISDVTDAYEHALCGRFPRARYVVGQSTKYTILILETLPEWLGDWLFSAMIKKKLNIIPAVLKK